MQNRKTTRNKMSSNNTTPPPPGFSTQPSPNQTQPESSQLPSPYVRTPRRTTKPNPIMEQIQNQMQLVAASLGTLNARLEALEQQKITTSPHSQSEAKLMPNQHNIFEMGDVVQSAPYFHTQLPPSENIKLESLTIANIVKFVDQVRSYEAETNYRLPLARKISKVVKLEILAESEKYNDSTINNITLADLIFEAKKKLRPFSVLDFLKKLDTNCQFTSTIDQPINMEKFRSAYLIFKTTFVSVYQFLASSVLDASHMPPVTTKKDLGLIDAFAKKIPFGYGTRVTAELLNATKSYNSIITFIDKFTEVIQRHYHASKTYSEVLCLFDQHASAKESKPSIQPSKVNAIKVLHDQNPLIDLSTCSDSHTGSQVIDTPLSDAPVHFDDTLPKDDNGSAAEHLETFIQQVTPYQKDSPKPCYSALFSDHGTCKNPGCKFTHDENILREAWLFYYKGLKKSVFKDQQKSALMPLHNPDFHTEDSQST